MKEIDKIRALSRQLPVKDRKLASKFIEDRDFDELNHLVISAIIKIRHNINSETPKEEYLSIDLDSLEQLQIKIDMYIAQLVRSVEDIEDDTDDAFSISETGWEE